MSFLLFCFTQRTINVEYNQLDPLLRATGFQDGDVNDPATGFSPFPGNINQLLFHLEEYSSTLDRTKGNMPEFVNPKYADAEKTIFKKPTRLECMMQDFPTVLEGEDSKKVGFTSIAADLCFSPVKNATADGVLLQQSGTHPGVAATGEADQYASMRKILSSIGCNIVDATPVSFNGIVITPGPEIVLAPSFAIFPAECQIKFPNPSNVKISSRSSLVVRGSGVIIESLDLDGALVIECEEGASGVIRNLIVKNAGWEKVACETNECDEVIRMRGFFIKKNETETIVIKNDSEVDGAHNVDLSAPAETANGQKNCCVIS
jgi:UDP-sugar pyrophosphorylase